MLAPFFSDRSICPGSSCVPMNSDCRPIKPTLASNLIPNWAPFSNIRLLPGLADRMFRKVRCVFSLLVLLLVPFCFYLVCCIPHGVLICYTLQNASKLSARQASTLSFLLGRFLYVFYCIPLYSSPFVLLSAFLRFTSFLSVGP
jgi:hypothetical protein